MFIHIQIRFKWKFHVTTNHYIFQNWTRMNKCSTRFFLSSYSTELWSVHVFYFHFIYKYREIYIYPTEYTNYVNTILIYFNRKKKASLTSATLLLLICLYIGLPCSSSNVKVYSTTQQLYGINKWFDKFNKLLYIICYSYIIL